MLRLRSNTNVVTVTRTASQRQMQRRYNNKYDSKIEQRVLAAAAQVQVQTQVQCQSNHPLLLSSLPSKPTFESVHSITTSRSLSTSSPRKIQTHAQTQTHEHTSPDSQLSKEERRKINIERHLKTQQEISHRAKQAALRKNAAKAIPHLMGRGEHGNLCFGWTLEALNLLSPPSYSSNSSMDQKHDLANQKSHTQETLFPSLSKHAVGLDYNDDDDDDDDDDDEMKRDNVVMAQYRDIYLDSMPSFATLLIEDPHIIDTYLDNEDSNSSSNSNATSNSSSKIEGLLDEMVQAGFSDLKFSKQHRMMNTNKTLFAEYVMRLSKKKQKYDVRYKRLIDVNHKLTKLKVALQKEQEQEQLAPPTMDLQVDKESGGFSFVRNFFSNLGLFPNQQHQQETSSPSSPSSPSSIKQNHILQQIEKQTKLQTHAKKALQTTQKQLKRLKSERDSHQPPLASSQYATANTIALKVLQTLSTAFAQHIRIRHSRKIQQYQTLDAQTDLTKPHEWYPRARFDRRTIVYHGGPTNSGKTYSALQRLIAAPSGLYLGPLRLLAAEVYETLTAKGVYANLYTGQERKEIAFSTHAAATVEVAPTDRDYDVVVIDEVQMIKDPFRGFAWSRALMGLRCKEIHVCGGMEAQSIVRSIAKVCGDDFVLNEYQRFGALVVSPTSLSPSTGSVGSYAKSVRTGDCVVAFSRNDIFAIKREIESRTKYKCCVVYGSLPPATRADQARRFNDPNSGYDILVASDAIGMGLNLNIRRIIFNSMFKSNGEKIVQLDHSSVKQISGRAGRRNSPYPTGEVTCRDPRDMEYLTMCMNTEIAPIEKAGLLPTATHIELFTAALEQFHLNDSGDLHKILRQFSEMATLQGDFFLCRQKQMRLISKFLNNLPLSISDTYTLCNAPVNETCKRSMSLLMKFAQKYAHGETPGLSRLTIPLKPKTFDDLSQLCSVHAELELFLWLAHRLSGNMGNLAEQQTALSLKERVITSINLGLAESEKLKLDHCYVKRDTNLRQTWESNKRKKSSEEYFVSDLEELDDFLLSEVDEI